MTNNIDKILKEQGRTKTWLASKLQVHKNTVHNWITEKTNPSYTDIVEVANILGVDYFDIKPK
jgi:DNA-binding XRE family transcriptional regulator